MFFQSECNIIFLLFSGEPGSHVFGSISDGVFHGKIISPRGGAWYVEKAHYYFPPHEINDTLHSVIYHENDVADAYAHLRKGSSNYLLLHFSYRKRVPKYMNITLGVGCRQRY